MTFFSHKITIVLFYNLAGALFLQHCWIEPLHPVLHDLTQQANEITPYAKIAKNKNLNRVFNFSYSDIGILSLLISIYNMLKINTPEYINAVIILALNSNPRKIPNNAFFIGISKI